MGQAEHHRDQGPAGTVRAFYNVCRHRGNKLVWDDYPDEETAGMCRRFTCKYHGWQYGLDGALEYVQQEGEFFDLDKSALGLVPVACDVWEGFIFVNLDPDPKQTLTEALAPVASGLAGYPFGEMTQTYYVRSEIDANWKLFIDAFVEFYHAPVLHQRQATGEEGDRLYRYGFEGLHYELFSPHAVVSSWGGIAPPKDPKMVKPIENILRAGLFGPWDKPELMKDRELPPMVNRAKHRGGGSTRGCLYPNFMILIWEPGWYMTYNYWPLGPSKAPVRVDAQLRSAEERARTDGARDGFLLDLGIRIPRREDIGSDAINDRGRRRRYICA